MKLVKPALIKEIDKYAVEVLGIPATELMQRSGEAVANAIRARLPRNLKIAILVGKGNNGGDGYAAALFLKADFDVTVYDVFSSGQRSDEGKYFLSEWIKQGGSVVKYDRTKEQNEDIRESDCIVDAIFGTGFSKSEAPDEIKMLSAVIEASNAYKVSVDVPLGINGEDGSVLDYAPHFDITVALSFLKRGLVSYPAKEYVGEIVYTDLGLPINKIEKQFGITDIYTDSLWAEALLPKRPLNSNKGSFGKLLIIAGSKKYRGAAHLAVEAALRSGVGLVCFLGENELINELVMKFPEVIYEKSMEIAEYTEKDIEKAVKLSEKFSAILIGPGSDNTKGLQKLVLSLLESEGAPIIIDADAINAVAALGEEGLNAIKNSKRKVALTPHPLEFSRLSGIEVAKIQKNRIFYAEKLSKELGATVILKGAATVISGENRLIINSNGTSALAKGGSGDVLAGVFASFLAEGSLGLADAAALAVYFHSLAGDLLSESLSDFGVIPSDLPKEIAKTIKETAFR